MIRHNVFDNNVGAMLVFRNGDKNIAYGNMFIRGSGGVRVKWANNILVLEIRSIMCIHLTRNILLLLSLLKKIYY